MSSDNNSNGGELVTTTSRDPVPIGSRGIMIQDMDSLARFAQCVAQSGLAPKGMNSPQAIAVAIQLGLEVGLTPMSALQNIAVINGRPGIFGDAALALVRASGLCEEFDEWFEQGGQKLSSNPARYTDDTAAVCMSVRKNAGIKITRFGVADAKQAKLWGKEGPWTFYPWRMLMFRARGFNLRDNFGDVLKGFKTVEEIQDYPEREPKQVQAEVTGVQDLPTGRHSAKTPRLTPAAAPAPEPAVAPEPAIPPEVQRGLEQAKAGQLVEGPDLAADQDELALMDLLNDLDDWIALAQTRQELHQVGKSMSEHRKWMGQLNYDQLLAKYRTRYQALGNKQT